MKRTGIRGLMAVGAFAFVLGAPFQAALAGDDDVGCGVGTTIMEGESGLVPHLLASFTNGVTFQSISLTLGVMGCDANDTITADAGLRKFASGNIDRLSRDIAVGGGESLDVFANLLGVTAQDRPAFAQTVQANFGVLFPSGETTVGEMLNSLDSVMASDERLARYVRG
ncbi:MAG: DUF3015 family protein [Deltaproteobacteria bacterium]|nr:DUF3015 family protein [Deltaproteobacteria bacterium]